MTASTSQSTRRWTRGSVLWLAAMTIMASFQTWRGAYEDGTLFFALVVLLIVDRMSGERLGSKIRRTQIRRSVVWGVAIVSGAVLVLAPRHEAFMFVVMTVIGVLMLVLAWAPLAAPAGELTLAIRRSGWWWTAIAVALCLWEAIAFVLSVTMPGGSDAHPTISVVLDPALETIIGRVVFVGM